MLLASASVESCTMCQACFRLGARSSSAFLGKHFAGFRKSSTANARCALSRHSPGTLSMCFNHDSSLVFFSQAFVMPVGAKRLLSFRQASDPAVALRWNMPVSVSQGAKNCHLSTRPWKEMLVLISQKIYINLHLSFHVSKLRKSAPAALNL